MTREVVIIRTGAANLASVAAGFRRLGVTPRFTELDEDVREAEYVVLPGVGALGPTRRRLEALGLVEPIIERAQQGRPLFAVCVGLQMLLTSSEESEDEQGLGIFSGRAARFPSHVRVPQLGWNEVRAPDAARYMVSGEFYFANSYRAERAPDGVLAAFAEHGGPFVAAFERGSLLACQFHPELSGKDGRAVMGRWLESSGEGS